MALSSDRHFTAEDPRLHPSSRAFKMTFDLQHDDNLKCFVAYALGIAPLEAPGRDAAITRPAVASAVSVRRSSHATDLARISCFGCR
jgi:hypothetical protein